MHCTIRGQVWYILKLHDYLHRKRRSSKSKTSLSQVYTSTHDCFISLNYYCEWHQNNESYAFSMPASVVFSLWNRHGSTLAMPNRTSVSLCEVSNLCHTSRVNVMLESNVLPQFHRLLVHWLHDACFMVTCQKYTQSPETSHLFLMLDKYEEVLVKWCMRMLISVTL